MNTQALQLPHDLQLPDPEQGADSEVSQRTEGAAGRSQARRGLPAAAPGHEGEAAQAVMSKTSQCTSP